ncbi:hypothetical protein B6U90_04160 [Thermoplasmatales archaeon ex4484_6]|nr:MAG: hypothetical protein B6U90_04160 [Thermoplasmatales archaeon ex4484_6]RLF69050.1 MAG: hypothetical protein DRN57_02045 [Thermoplasmata archaeon]
MRDWLDLNIRGSSDAKRIFEEEGGIQEASGPKKGDVHPLGLSTRYSSGAAAEEIDTHDQWLSLISSITSSGDVDSLCGALRENLGRTVMFDYGSLRWRPLDRNYDESMMEYPEDDMPYQKDFSNISGMVPFEECISFDDEIPRSDGTEYIENCAFQLRLRTETGDPVRLPVRSMIRAPLRYEGQDVGRVLLFSSRGMGISAGTRAFMDRIWEIAGNQLGQILRLEALEREKERLNDLIDSTDDLIIVWKMRDSIWEIDMNGPAEDIVKHHGLIPEMMEGPFFVQPGAEWERAMVAWRTAFESGEECQMDLDIEDPSGGRSSYLCRFSPIRTGNETSGVRMTGTRMEGLESGIRKLKINNRTYRLLISVLAHDLKNPLTALSGYSELLEMADDEKKHAYLDKISRLIRRMSETISLTKTFARIREGKLLSEFEEIDLKKMVDSCLEMLYPNTEDHVIVRDVCDRELRIKGHYFLEQVILNLLDNAMKYTDKGSEIRISMRASLEGTTLSISDQGPGIPDAYKSSIFERFSRGERVEGIQGTGLGLAISKEIVEIHGGRIWVEDRKGGGSVFKVFLPWEPGE